MSDNFRFFLNSILLGIGLAMDAFSVSLANGLNEPHMPAARMALIAGIFGFFQSAMPLIGWYCVSTIAYYFSLFTQFIPWIALILLGTIGGHMLYEGIRYKNVNKEKPALGLSALLVQGVATSIDALSVGFTISEYTWIMALFSSLIIGLITFVICLAGLAIGKKFGTKLTGKAGMLGGSILIFIGLEIFVGHLL